MSNKIYFNAEGFNLKTEKLDNGKESVILEGVAMPLNKTSRNKVFYRPESVRKAYATMKGAAFLFNHDTNVPLGHVEDTSLDDNNMYYRANVDPDETKYVNKVKRQDIRHVSVGCLVSNVEFADDGSAICDVDEFVELSLVPVPGFHDATASVSENITPLLLAEKLGDTSAIEKLKARKEAEEEPEKPEDKKDEEVCPVCGKEPCECPKDKEEKCKKKEGEEEEPKDKEESEEEPEKKDEEEDEDKPKEEKLKKEEVSEETQEEKISRMDLKLTEVLGQIEELVSRLAIAESKIDAFVEAKEKEDDEVEAEPKETPAEDKPEEEAPEETEEPKKEEEPMDKPEEEEKPKEEEKFENTKSVQGIISKEALEKKEKILFGKETEKLNEGSKKVVKIDNRTRLNNLSY